MLFPSASVLTVFGAGFVGSAGTAVVGAALGSLEKESQPTKVARKIADNTADVRSIGKSLEERLCNSV